jgi:type II secretory pathway predicted ATPase ExeA
VFYAINTHVRELGNDKLHPVLLIDEAHLLHQDVLEHLHILANYEWDSRALLSIILVGLPETRHRLALAKNRSLWSRIHTRLALGEATPGDTAEYIAHRLRRAGCERELFNSDAITVIHEQSQGRLRDTDRIATDALKLGARKKIKTVDRELVARVLGDEPALGDD